MTALMTADPVRLAWAAAAIVLWLAFTIVMLWRGRRARPAEARDGGWLIAVASQTGFAEELAEMTEALVAPTGPVRTVLLGDLEAADLRAAGRVLFVVSTTGEGDSPDSASWFVRKVMGAEADLSGVRYGLLALGDHTYKDFCAFGRALDAWLRRSGAEALFDAVEVDNGDTGAVRHWQHQVAAAAGATAQADWTPPTLDRWRLVERRLLNPDSPGARRIIWRSSRWTVPPTGSPETSPRSACPPSTASHPAAANTLSLPCPRTGGWSCCCA